MQFDENTIRTTVRLTSDDNKMLLLNGRYYCELTESQKTREVEPRYCFFSESWKEENSPTLTQYTDCFVFDASIGKGHHKRQYGKLYHSVHDDLDCMHTFSLMLSGDRALISVMSIEVIDKPRLFWCHYALKKAVYFWQSVVCRLLRSFLGHFKLK